jgi:hypothetical protein
MLVWIIQEINKELMRAIDKKNLFCVKAAFDRIPDHM